MTGFQKILIYRCNLVSPFYIINCTICHYHCFYPSVFFSTFASCSCTVSFVINMPSKNTVSRLQPTPSVKALVLPVHPF
ncbi:unnamed protein product [Schistosoma mansoni]|uniref:Smp_204850 n=1 Tax=Schistosoma mansoni TaxID=6183 RepID=UPI00022C82E8|nr:unnamed protein product [Schistosoma mansoni]|eukprot:XP_018646809.1 unnamed protein product [Schistosoma mansoni]